MSLFETKYVVISHHGSMHRMTAKQLCERIKQDSKSDYNWISPARELVRVCKLPGFPIECAIIIKVAILNCFANIEHRANCGGDRYYTDPSDEKAVKYVVYTSDMDATEGGFIADDAAVAVFDSVKHRITDDGDLVYEINYFVKGKMNTALYTDNEMVTASLSKLKQGDMFYFSKNMMNEIDKIEKVSRYNLITASGYFHAKENNDEEIFGRVAEINHEVLDDLKNTIVDEIKVRTATVEKRFVMPLDDMPYIYLFDTAAREITPATTDDLFSGDSENASDVYIFTRRNEVKGIVIVV